MNTQDIQTLIAKLDAGSGTLTEADSKILKAALAAFIDLQAVMVKLEDHAIISQDLRADIADGLKSADLAKMHSLLGQPTGKDFDFNTARQARAKMFDDINSAADAKAILASVFKFALAVAPLLL